MIRSTPTALKPGVFPEQGNFMTDQKTTADLPEGSDHAAKGSATEGTGADSTPTAAPASGATEGQAANPGQHQEQAGMRS